MLTSATAAPALAIAALSSPAPVRPADLATLKGLVRDALVAQLQLVDALRRLESAAGSGPWQRDLVISMEKADASGFWFREGTRSLQAAKGNQLLFLPAS